MKLSTAAAAFLALTPAASAHYVFDKLIVNGQITGSFEYVRANTRRIIYMPTKFLESDSITPLDNDFRCNEGSFTNAGKTKTATVAAGDTIGVQLWYGATMQHPGPIQVYMSKAPGLASQYDGSGDWFKIHQETVCGSTSDGLQDTDWCTWDKDRVTFRIPPDTPPGEYLVRPEHIALHGAHGGHAEFYFSCAQIKVTGSGNGTPGPTVKIPGVYDNTEPGIRFNIYGARDYPHKPGPAVWTGGSNGGNPTNPNPGCAALYGQCGGSGWTGPKCCSSGTCRVSNEWYSQCL
jgi:hypothetical protein